MLFASDNVSTMGGASLHDALPDQWMESLEFMKRLDVSTIATGHGNLVTDKVTFYLDQQISAIRERFEAVKRFKAEGLRLREAVEKYEEMFPEATQAPASEGFSVRGGPGAGLFPLLHLYQIIGGNTGL
jgi:glyoxylase-like metal-dependent hydrolase (beta-lactamase superfamily II)